MKGISLDALFRVLAPVASQRSSAPAIEAAHKNILFPTESDLPKAALDRATAAQGEKSGAVAAAFISAGPDNLAQWQQTMQMAGTKRLPIIFVHYVEPAIAFQPANSKKHGALLHGVPSIAVDALDAVAVYRVAYEAIVRARQLRGATLLQCILQRDSPLAEQVPVNSVETMETYLKSKGIEPEGHNHEVVAAFNRDLDLATRFLHK